MIKPEFFNVKSWNFKTFVWEDSETFSAKSEAFSYAKILYNKGTPSKVLWNDVVIFHICPVSERKYELMLEAETASDMMNFEKALLVGISSYYSEILHRHKSSIAQATILVDRLKIHKNETEYFKSVLTNPLVVGPEIKAGSITELALFDSNLQQIFFATG